MKYEEYVKRAQKAAQLAEKEDYTSALEILKSLVESDLAVPDKAMMCLNIAIIWDKLGQPEEALQWYERGMDYERRAGGCFVAEHRAAYLANLNRLEESLLAYEELAARESLDEQSRERVRQNIDRLRAQLA